MKAEKIKCEICGAMEHVLEPHLKKVHGVNADQYREKYPDALVLSDFAREKLAEMRRGKGNRRFTFDIESTFGISIEGKITEIQGWEKPHVSTPKVDPTYVFSKENLMLVLATLDDSEEQCLFVGPTGSGKTSCVEQAIARLNLPLTRINGDGEMTRADLIGQHILKGNETQFEYGLIVKAVREGHVLLLDEHDCLDPSVKQALQAVMEPGGKLVITETSEVIEKHKDFRLFATGNTLGQGDETGLYAGTQPQNYANTMRFTLFGIVDYPKKKVERKIIIAKTGITDKNVLDLMLEYAAEMRSAYKKQSVMAVMSTRSLINIAKKLIKFGDVRSAYEFGYINAQNSDDQRFCSELLQRVWEV